MPASLNGSTSFFNPQKYLKTLLRRIGIVILVRDYSIKRGRVLSRMWRNAFEDGSQWTPFIYGTHRDTLQGALRRERMKRLKRILSLLLVL
jgi:hypothetical protein